LHIYPRDEGTPQKREHEVSEDPTGPHQTGLALSWRLQVLAALALAFVAAVSVFLLVREPQSKGSDSEISSQSKRAQHFYQPTDAEWATLTVEPVQEQPFRTEHVTEG